MGSFLTTFTILFAGLLVCHIGMFVAGKQPKGWKVIDYVWLGAAAVSLIGVTAEARRIVAINTSSLYEERFQSELKFAQWYVISLRDYYLRWDFDKWEPTEENKKAELAFREAGQRLVYAASKLSESPDTRPWTQLLNMPQMLGSAKDPNVIQEEDRLRRILKGLDETYQELLNNRTEKDRSSSEQAFVVLWPWLLATALAIRITKVTAELRGLA